MDFRRRHVEDAAARCQPTAVGTERRRADVAQGPGLADRGPEWALRARQEGQLEDAGRRGGRTAQTAAGSPRRIAEKLIKMFIIYAFNLTVFDKIFKKYNLKTIKRFSSEFLINFD